MKLTSFRVKNYRNIHDSGLINVNQITAFVGQNEAGKSNLFEALYRINPFEEQAAYNINEDWPMDKWGEKDEKSLVCIAHFELNSYEIESFISSSFISEDEEDWENIDLPDSLTITGSRGYNSDTHYLPSDELKDKLDDSKIQEWAREYVLKFVYIHDYEMSGAQIELDNLKVRKGQVRWDDLDTNEQTILTILDLAKIDIDELAEKGDSPDGRTTRTFDTLAASKFLSGQFNDLWRQKKVDFDIRIDGNTLNIFVIDKEVGMPIRLNKRSTGFRWHVSFAWKFTHASKGRFSNCIILLEEPGIHLHYDGQMDLLAVFERLKENNTILYTTHLASMVDLGFPERIRIVECHQGKSTVRTGILSSQSGAAAVIEMSLGLSKNMIGFLGNRKTLIVEGGDDALILQKLSHVLGISGKEALSQSIYLWPAKGASKTPMFAAFAIGQKWQAGVLLDTDKEGEDAKAKIKELYLDKLSELEKRKFRVFLLGQAAGIRKTDAAIEDIFPDPFYLRLVNEAYRINISMDDLPDYGSSMITKRIEHVLRTSYQKESLDKTRVTNVLLKRFESWKDVKDLPTGTATKAQKLFKTINAAFEPAQSSS